MIDLNQYLQFKLDVEGSATEDSTLPITNIHPILIMHTPDPIYLSHTEEMINVNNVSTLFSAVNLKVPAIKESIDLENRKLKVNNVSISFSNYSQDAFKRVPYFKNNNYFSNLFSTHNFIGVSVDLYWKSQSLKSLEECLPIFRGKIQRLLK